MIHETITNVMNDIVAIGKTRKNVAQNFQFRGIDDVTNSLHPIFAQHGLYVIPRVVSERSEERTTKSGGVLIHRMITMEFDLIDKTGDKITVGPIIGEAMDSGDKASNKAMSIALKYMLFQTFLIPTEEMKDPDHDSYEITHSKNSRVKQEKQEITLIDLIEEIESYGLPRDRVETWARKQWGVGLADLSLAQKQTVLSKLPGFADALLQEVVQQAN